MIRLIDFGLSQRLRVNEIIVGEGGTPGYMAPETSGGRTKTVTSKADVWSVGVMLYQFKTVRSVFFHLWQQGKNGIPTIFLNDAAFVKI